METTNNIAARNHFLPQYYLKGFALRRSAGAPLTVIRTVRRPDKDGSLAEKPLTPKAVGYENHLYSIVPVNAHDPSSPSDEIERRFFGLIDANGAAAMRRMVEVGPSKLTDGERANWALFLNSLLERTPTVLSEQNVIANQKGREWIDNFLSKQSEPESRAMWLRILDRFSPEAASKNAVLRAMCAKIVDQDVIDYFVRFKWVILNLTGPSDAEYLTSNVPVVVNCGLPGPIHFLSLALSPLRLFVMYKSDQFTDEIVAKFSLIHNLKLFEQSTCIYSRAPLLDGDFARVRRAAETTLLRRDTDLEIAID